MLYSFYIVDTFKSSWPRFCCCIRLLVFFPQLSGFLSCQAWPVVFRSLLPDTARSFVSSSPLPFFLALSTHLKTLLLCMPLALSISTNKVLQYLMGRFPCFISRTVAVPSYKLISSFLIILIANNTLYDVLVSSIVSFPWFVFVKVDIRILYVFLSCLGRRNAVDGTKL